jgi:NADPH:quinone reductase-like Zn-dependent oxidoreductase
MRAVVTLKDAMSLQDVAVPTPTADEVLIKVHASSVNPVDWKIQVPSTTRDHSAFEDVPYVGGFDVAGVVVAVGEDVRQLEVGEQV